MRRRYEPTEQQSSDYRSGIHTPRNIKSPSNIDFSRQSTTPSRVQERLSTSPLKVPLSKAISRAVKKDSSIEKSSSSRYLGRSSRRDESSIISLAKKIYYDEDMETQMQRAHPETLEFIRKNFRDIDQDIPFEKFIQTILRDYEYLWGNQNVDKIFDDFTYKIADIFGSDYVDLRELSRITRQDGMIGLILRIFKEVKNEENGRNSNYASFSQNPQIQSINRSFEERLTENESLAGLKNVIQQFMESMYQAMEGQIYSRYNVEMKRMILKYRETEKLLKKTNEKITTYADVVDFDKKYREAKNEYEKKIQILGQEKEKMALELEREKQGRANERREREKMECEISRLKENLDKYQNALLNRVIDHNEEPMKRVGGQSRAFEKPYYEGMRTSQISQNPDPIKITIDTQVVHKENKAPETKTITTFHNGPPLPSVSPRRDSYESPMISTSQIHPSQFNTSRVSTSSYRPVSPLANRGIRPI